MHTRWQSENTESRPRTKADAPIRDLRVVRRSVDLRHHRRGRLAVSNPNLQLQRARRDSSRPILRLRVWRNAYGSVFQIHRTRPLNAQTLTSYYEVDSLTESQKQALIENPKLEDASFIPRWSRLRRAWPAGLLPIADRLEKGRMWYELRMGWPLHCLRGGYTTHSYASGDAIRNTYGVIPVWRPVAYWGPGRQFGLSLVGLPLIPDWPAFLTSVLLYGALTFAGATAWRSARAWRRRRRGKCVACGYELTGNTSGICPECGEPTATGTRTA